MSSDTLTVDLTIAEAAPPPSYDALAQQAAQLGQQLIQRGWMVATVESCTGGLIAAALTEVAGSSAWFERGFVTYSNAAKTGAVDVATALIDTHGAVSEPVAAAMARGGLLASQARITASVTGVAGPSGGSAEKPVGTVCFGWAYRSAKNTAPVVHTVTCHFDGDRASVRRQSARHALHGLALLVSHTTTGT